MIVGPFKRRLSNFRLKFNIVLLTCLVSIFVLPGNLLANEFLQTFLIKYSGGFVPGDEAVLAKYDLIAVQRFRYKDIQNDTWSAIKTINPNTEIFNYQLGRATRADQDYNNIPFSGTINRWKVSRDHSMGSIADNYDEFVLLDSGDNEIINPSYKHEILLDIGNSTLQNYWSEAVVTDIVGHPWQADGLFVDVTTMMRTSMSAMPVKYPTDAAWSKAMNSFLNSVTVSLGAKGQKIWCNRTRGGTEFGYNAYLALDATANPPYAVFDEGVFAVEWGRNDAIIKFTDLSTWKLHVDIMSKIHNSKVTMLSHIPIADGSSGYDNFGKQLNSWDILWYAMGSFHLGKNTIDNNSYFGIRKQETYNNVHWYDEFEDIDLGKAVGKYNITNYNGNDIYWREFQKGYVYVNPNVNDVSFITLPENCKQLTHSNFLKSPATLPIINTISLKGHRAAFLLKEVGDSLGLHPPNNIKISLR